MGTCPIKLDIEGRDIQAEANRIRAEGPVTLVEVPGGYHAWCVTSYEVGKKLLSGYQLSKNAKLDWPPFVRGEVPHDWELITWVAMDNLTVRDGDDHDRLRKLVSHAFTPREVEKARPRVEAIVQRLLDDIEATTGPGETVDIKGRFTYALTATLICDLFGVPVEVREEALKGTKQNSLTNHTGEMAAANLDQWHDAMSRLAERRRQDPGDDLTSVLIAANEDGETLSNEELIGSLHVLLGAGSETLSNVLAHCIIDLSTHRDQLELVRSGQYTWMDAFDESVRKDAAVAQLPFRYAKEDIDVAGVHIAKGDLVLIAYAGIGRDPALHGDTRNDFDITRADKTNLSFGHGVHYCLGRPLATMQSMIALPAIFERFPDLTLAVPREQLPPQGTFIMNGYDRVPMYLTAAVPAAV